MSIVTGRDVSFVLQGPVANNDTCRGTSRVIASIRKLYPESPIILSTWKDEIGSGHRLDVDQLVLSEDPGALHRSGLMNHNTNRQIVSTKAGLDVVTTKYAVKLRSDLKLTHRGIVRWLNHPVRAYPRDAYFSWLNERVLVVNVTSVNPKLEEQLPFHVCDWIWAGLAEDVRAVWDAPLFDDANWAFWFDGRPIPENHPFKNSLARYHPESFIWSSFVSKYIHFSFDHLADISGDNLALSEKSIASNLVILTRSQLGIRWLKNKVELWHLASMYSFSSWRNLVRIHVGDLPALIYIDFEWALARVSRLIVDVKRKALHFLSYLYRKVFEK